MAPDSHTQAGTILVAVDFSACSESALVWAARAARRFEAPLAVLHVVHDPGAAPGGRVRRMQEVAVDLLAEYLAGARTRLAAYTMELGVLENLKHSYYFTKRIARMTPPSGSQDASED